MIYDFMSLRDGSQPLPDRRTRRRRRTYGLGLIQGGMHVLRCPLLATAGAQDEDRGGEAIGYASARSSVLEARRGSACAGDAMWPSTMGRVLRIGGGRTGGVAIDSRFLKGFPCQLS